MKDKNEIYKNIRKEKFALVSGKDRSHDVKPETKPVGYFRDALNRFSKNKASVVAAVINAVLLLFAIVGPYFCNQKYIS